MNRLPRQARPHKYGAKAVVIDGIRFPSQAEGRRYGELKLLEKAGEISSLTLQDRWPLMVPWPEALSGKRAIGHYVSDFRYYDEKVHDWITEDVKGMRTALYVWKRKHFEAQYGVVITEITRSR